MVMLYFAFILIRMLEKEKKKKQAAYLELAD